MQFGVEITCGSSRIELTTFGGGKTVFYVEGNRFKAAIFCALYVCGLLVIFLTPLKTLTSFLIGSEIYFIFFHRQKHIFHSPEFCHRINSALRSRLQNTAGTSWLTYDTLLCEKLTLAATYSFAYAWFIICDLEWRQVEWVVILSFEGLLAVLWHMDNPTRNQSLHSYWGNRWANMFPGVCPYYSGASGAPGDCRARWNWSVVTTDWTGNELLQDKWAATREMKNPTTKGERVSGSIHQHTFPQFYPCKKKCSV